MKYVDLDNGMRVGWIDNYIAIYDRVRDAFGTEHYSMCTSAVSVDDAKYGVLVKAIAALVEKLEGANEQA